MSDSIMSTTPKRSKMAPSQAAAERGSPHIVREFCAALRRAFTSHANELQAGAACAALEGSTRVQYTTLRTPRTQSLRAPVAAAVRSGRTRSASAAAVLWGPPLRTKARPASTGESLIGMSNGVGFAERVNLHEQSQRVSRQLHPFDAVAQVGNARLGLALEANRSSRRSMRAKSASKTGSLARVRQLAVHQCGHFGARCAASTMGKSPDQRISSPLRPSDARCLRRTLVALFQNGRRSVPLSPVRLPRPRPSGSCEGGQQVRLLREVRARRAGAWRAGVGAGQRRTKQNTDAQTVVSVGSSTAASVERKERRCLSPTRT